MPIVDKVVKQDRVPTELMHEVAAVLPEVTFAYDPNYPYEGAISGAVMKQGAYGTTPHATVNVQVQGKAYGSGSVGSARLWVDVPFNDPAGMQSLLDILTKAGPRLCKAAQHAMDEHKAKLEAQQAQLASEEAQQVG